jgi:hypothetical protein
MEQAPWFFWFRDWVEKPQGLLARWRPFRFRRRWLDAEQVHCAGAQFLGVEVSERRPKLASRFPTTARSREEATRSVSISLIDADPLPALNPHSRVG